MRLRRVFQHFQPMRARYRQDRIEIGRQAIEVDR